MRLFDTHCHFETSDADDIAAILTRAKSAGVEKLMAVGGSDALNDAAMAAASLRANEKCKIENGELWSLPDVICAVGFDRDQVGKVSPESSSLFPLPSSLIPLPTSLFPHPSSRSPIPVPHISAIGEIGLDYHYAPGSHKEQTELFAAQLETARKLDKPVVIHTREAAEDTISILREIPSRGIIHCFTGEPDEAAAYLDLGFFVSISGIVTFKAADNVRRTALYIPDDRILIETDSPFLAPVPLRGKTNEPAFIKHTCEFLAALRGMPAEDFAELTFANAEKVLGA